MKNKIELFEDKELGLKIRIGLKDNGSIPMNAENTAIRVGWVIVAKSGNKTVRW